MFGRKIKNSAKIFVGSIVFLLFCLNIQGQENIQFSQGKVEEGMNSSIGIPLMSYKGRGISLPISLNYSSNVWRIDNINTVLNGEFIAYQTMTQAIYSEYATSGWKSSLDLPVIEFPKFTDAYWSTGGAYCPTCGGSGNAYRVSKVTIHMPDGSTHELRESDTPDNTGSVDVSGTFYAVDGSRLRYDSTDVDTGTLYLPDGTRYILDGGSAQWIDVHGNTLNYSGTNRQWTDTLGRVIGMPIPANPQAQDYTYNLPGLDGVNDDVQAYTFKWRELEDVLTPDASNNTPDLRVMASHYLSYPSSNPTAPSGNNYPQEQDSQYQSLFSSEGVDGAEVITMVVGKGQSESQLFNPIVLAEVVLPDGSKYKFSYNVYGEVDKISYPTGAYEKYTMQQIGGSYNLSVPYDQANRGATSRKLSIDGTGNDILEWTYSKQENGSFDRYRIIAPDNTCSEVYKAKLEAPVHGPPNYKQYWDFGFTDPQSGATVETRAYSSSTTPCGGNLLRRELTAYERTVHDVMTLANGWHVFAYRNPRTVKKTSVIFEGSGSALAQTTTFSYDTTYEMTTGLDQVTTNSYHYAVISNNSSSDTAQAGTISQISSGSLASSTETIYSSSSTYRDANILALPTVAKVYDGSGSSIVSQIETVYDETTYSPAVGRALPTSVKTWDSAKGTDPSNSGNYIIAKTKYDTYGNPIEATDAKGYLTTVTYDSTYHTYPVSTASSVPDDNGTYGSSTALTTGAAFDAITGLMLSTTDANGQTATMEYEDPMLRPTKTTAPNGQQTTIEYGEPDTNGVLIASQRYIRTKTQIDDSKWSEAYVWVDGLARTIKTQKVDSAGDIFVETEYDNKGRVKKVSNPYRAGETVLKTENFYDDQGRLTKVKTPDNAEVETSYALATSGSQIGTIATVEDQADKLRRSITNARGQLIRVDEPAESGGLGTISSPNQATIYAYDTLNNLTTVTQGSQTRTYTYSSLARLLSTVNPESGTISYTYDDNGNLTQKSQDRSSFVTVTTAYTYDRLNRVKTRSYSGESGYTTPTASYYYDNVTNAKGKLIKVSSSVSSTEFLTFDVMGHVTRSKQVTDGVTYGTDENPMTYTYNLSGALIEQKYPSGRVVKNVLDNDGDLSAVQSKKNAASGYWNYADSFTYNSAGAITSMQLGNGHWESMQFNSRLQPTQIALGGTPGASNLLKLDYNYGTTQDNGNIQSQTITVSGASGFTAVQNYAYDSVNRLESADEKPYGWTNCTSDPTKCWKQTFAYDRYGNRRFDETNTTMPTSFASPAITNPTINTANNRLSSSGYTYDNSGNLTANAGGQTYTYDGENKQVEVKNSSSVTIGQYWYDGDGKRIKKYAPSTGETTIFVYDASGKMVAESSTVLNTTPQVSYLTNDHLGSPRINTNENGDVISRHDYHPFGEEIATSQRTSTNGYATDDNRKQFTNYERDDETGLDFAQARMYANQHGRFTTVDPVLMMPDRQIDPQQINLYAYCRNNPFSFVDPTGMILDPTTWDKDAKKAFEKYVDFLNKNPKKYASELATLDQLKKSDVNYVVRLDQSGSDLSNGKEGGVTTDGKDIFINIANQGNGSEKISLNATFGHELEHARQFDSGEFGFASDKNGDFVDKNGKFIGSSVGLDITDEVKAWEVTAKLATNSDKAVMGGDPNPEFQFRVLDEFTKSSNKAGVLAKVADSYKALGKTASNFPSVTGKPVGTLIRPSTMNFKDARGNLIKAFGRTN